ncbi:MAG: glycosyltransferase [Sandaracinaceae bacterium]|nr:glycosyltransferase [Sandaracinaceae bacterium]
MQFSVCIPNFNYEKYVGRTIQSVLGQTYPDFEVLVSDNASTDGSVNVVKSITDSRVKLRINACNVGFAGNLDRAGRMATGDVMILLSSDDMMLPSALATYNALYNALGPTEAARAIVCSSCDVIDANDNRTSSLRFDPELFTEEDRIHGIDLPTKAPVYRVDGAELLRRCLRTMRNPFNFLATAYPRSVYERLEGYGGNRNVNPDKWFHWRLLGADTVAYFIDEPLFAYRWHATNQNAQEGASGALKYLADEYTSTFEIDKALLARIGMTREDVEVAFVECDIARHGLNLLAQGNRTKASRVRAFGAATYPNHVRRNPRYWALSALLAAGPVGVAAARAAYRLTRGEKSK